MNSCIVTGMYVRIAGSREFSPGTLFGVDTDCVRSTFGVQDLTITNCYLSDAEVLIAIKNWSFGFYFSGFNISSNQLYRSCISLTFNTAFASLTPGFIRNIFILNNVFDHQTPWSAPPENSSYGLHLNYIFPFLANNGGDLNGYGSVVSNVWIGGNYFGPDVCGTNFNTSLAIQTQWAVTNAIETDFYVYNNVFVWTNTICHSLWNNAFVTITGTTNLYVVNNDFIVDPAVDCDTGLLSGRNTVNVMESNPVWFVNNFTKNCHLQNYFNGGGTQTNYVAGTWSDYNVFALPWTLYTAGNLGQYDFFGPDPAFPVNGVGYAFPDFTNHLFTVGPVPARFDVHSTTNNPAINSDYSPQTNSILLNAATNLSAIGITTDYLGHGRPLTGNWTIGAFQLAQGGGVTNPVACFTGTPVSGFSPLLVTFTDCSQNASTWSWDFGDTGTSTSQNPTHTYMSPGTYTVTQTVTGFGQTNSLTRINYIFVDQHQTVTNVFQGQFQF
jgi:PKD repeat protein